MDFSDIEYFAVLAKHGNVARAAESLNLSPPALSVSLRRLETTRQTRLFRRTGVLYRAGGYLSPAGRRFVEILKKIAAPFANNKTKNPTTKE